eukprot:scaffold377_cov563-Prasinococcus_capsulatus_cf.AAC.13
MALVCNRKLDAFVSELNDCSSASITGAIVPDVPDCLLCALPDDDDLVPFGGTGQGSAMSLMFFREDGGRTGTRISPEMHVGVAQGVEPVGSEYEVMCKRLSGREQQAQETLQRLNFPWPRRWATPEE